MSGLPWTALQNNGEHRLLRFQQRVDKPVYCPAAEAQGHGHSQDALRSFPHIFGCLSLSLGDNLTAAISAAHANQCLTFPLCPSFKCVVLFFIGLTAKLKTQICLPPGIIILHANRYSAQRFLYDLPAAGAVIYFPVSAISTTITVSYHSCFHNFSL